MSHRFQVVLPDPAAVQLREIAAAAGEPPSTLAAQILRRGLSEDRREGRSGPSGRPRRSARPIGRERAGWLEPYGGDPGWRERMWGEIVALHGRYPEHLEALNEGWWQREAHVEILAAFALWRAEIDDAGDDPREELAFHRQLEDYARTLREQGGGVTKAWIPGAPPNEWV